jgi:hypothetical protein
LGAADQFIVSSLQLNCVTGNCGKGTVQTEATTITSAARSAGLRKLNPTSLGEVQALLDWSDLRVYNLNDTGKNHSILLGTSGWKP